MDFLKKLGIEQENYGASLGPGHWGVRLLTQVRLNLKTPLMVRL